LYVVGRYDASSSFIHAASIYWSICFHLGMQKVAQGCLKCVVCM
jgi:hypothetical protein